ncbi:MAG: hypothetical protein HQ559_14235 [Lentisphaerae bacterium]|nr:hypothetical protein [Lentisphaerota bacterium]
MSKASSKLLSGLSSRITFGVIAVVVNLALWELGVRLDKPLFGVSLDSTGAAICRVTGPLAFWLIPTTILYAQVRRFAWNKSWDLWGPGLAVIAVVIVLMQTELHTRY